MMIHTLSIELADGPRPCDPIHWVIEIPGEWDIDDLRELLFKLLALDDDHGSGFFIANQAWGGKKIWLDDDDYNFQIEETALMPAFFEPPDTDRPGTTVPNFDQLYPLPKHRKLYFLYDFGASWRFEIRRKGRARPAQAGIEYPRVRSGSGQVPDPYPPDEDDWAGDDEEESGAGDEPPPSS